MNWPRSTIRQPSPPSLGTHTQHTQRTQTARMQLKPDCTLSTRHHTFSRLEVLSRKKNEVPRQHLCLIHGIRVVKSDWQLTSCNFLNRGMISSLGRVSANYQSGLFVSSLSLSFFPLPFFFLSVFGLVNGMLPCVGGYSGISAQPTACSDWLSFGAGKHFVSSPQV